MQLSVLTIKKHWFNTPFFLFFALARYGSFQIQVGLLRRLLTGIGLYLMKNFTSFKVTNEHLSQISLCSCSITVISWSFQIFRFSIRDTSSPSKKYALIHSWNLAIILVMVVPQKDKALSARNRGQSIAFWLKTEIPLLRLLVGDSKDSYPP